MRIRDLTNFKLSLKQQELVMARQCFEIVQNSQKLDGRMEGWPDRRMKGQIGIRAEIWKDGPTDRPSYTGASQDPKT